MKELSRPGRGYVLAMLALGGGLILSSVIQLALETTTPYWVIVISAGPVSTRRLGSGTDRVPWIPSQPPHEWSILADDWRAANDDLAPQVTGAVA